MALYLLYRGIRDRKYFAGLGERLGFLPPSLEPTGAGSIWFHAVSVGEVLSSVELIRRLRAQRPHVNIFVSTTTLAGRAMADQKLAGLAQGVIFAPLDYRSVIRRVLRRLRPALVVVLETEIWPNLYRESKRAGAALIVVNGRISDREFPRYRRWRGFFRYVLNWPDRILVQTEEDARRYVAAGAAPDCVTTGGNLKYDFVPPSGGPSEPIAQFLARVNPAKIWVAASTMPPMDAGDVDEDDAVIAAFPEISGAGLLVILVPRRPERFDSAAAKLEAVGIPFVRRSRLSGETALSLPGVLLLDSMGELAAVFACADVVFMGGTLARRGGHNILEPAYFGKPTIVGPHMENFAAIGEEFQHAGALEQIQEAGELGRSVNRLFDDAARAAQIGGRARELAASKRGVTARIGEEIWRWYAEGIPQRPRLLVARILLTPLAWIWRAGNRVKVSNGLAARRALKTAAVSIGGLTMGGAGKSPMVGHLAARLKELGHNPAILTRGYKRRFPDNLTVVPRGGKADIEVTGDEAQIFIRAGDAHVGIGADRFAAGQRLEELGPGIILLDDGFQHVRLARKHDVVLIDALDPLGGGVFPLGRLREPLASLKRATEIVITRVEQDQDTTGLERLLRRYNAEAAVFRSRVVPRQWMDLGWNQAAGISAPGFRRVAAFCGLGMPRTFWRTLEGLGLEVVFRKAFGDHHRYHAAELRQMSEQASAAGAEALVTTEKDVFNLCDDAESQAAPHKLLWLKIGIEIEKEEEFLRRIL